MTDYSFAFSVAIAVSNIDIVDSEIPFNMGQNCSIKPNTAHNISSLKLPVKQAQHKITYQTMFHVIMFNYGIKDTKS